MKRKDGMNSSEKMSTGDQPLECKLARVPQRRLQADLVVELFNPDVILIPLFPLLIHLILLQPLSLSINDRTPSSLCARARLPP